MKKQKRDIIKKINKLTLNKSNMNTNKLVLTKVDGSEVTLDFTKEVNLEDLAPTTLSKIVITKEDGTVVTVFDSSTPSTTPTFTVPLNTPIVLVAA